MPRRIRNRPSVADERIEESAITAATRNRNTA